MVKETSKRLLLLVLVYCAAALTYILIVWASREISNAPAMASIYSAPAAGVIGFYEWKARGENLMKICSGKIPDEVLKLWAKHNSKATTTSDDDDDVAG